MITEQALANSDGSDIFSALITPLTSDKVRHIGEPVAMVTADSLAAARCGRAHHLGRCRK